MGYGTGGYGIGGYGVGSFARLFIADHSTYKASIDTDIPEVQQNLESDGPEDLPTITTDRPYIDDQTDDLQAQ